MPSRRDSRSRRFGPTRQRLIAAIVAAQLVAAVAGAVALETGHDPVAPPAAVRGRVVPHLDAGAVRTTEVQALLDRRARALRTGSRAAWLAEVDPTAQDFVRRQDALFTALRGVPLSDWTYRVDGNSSSPSGVQLDDVRGVGWWAPEVTLSYRIAGYDEQPTLEVQRLTFVPRGDTWFLAADDDFASVGKDTARGLWDDGPVVLVRGRSCLVLGHPGWRSLMRRVAASVDAAVPRVTSVWGPAWSQHVVVLVPASAAELQRIVGGNGDYSQIAAVATAELTDGSSGYHPVGDRVVVNPPNFAKLGSLGRRVVLTHEVAHVATRAATGPSAPAWLVEGFADYIGYRGVDVPYSLSAQELRDEVRVHHLPAALPSEQDFAGSNPHLAEIYEEAWTAVSLLAETYGEQSLVRFYRAAGSASSTQTGLDDAFAALGTTPAQFLADWRRNLPTRLR